MKNIPCCYAHPHFSTVNIELEASHYLVTILTLPYKSAIPQTNPNFPNKKGPVSPFPTMCVKLIKHQFLSEIVNNFLHFFIDFNIQSNFS